LPGKDYKKFEPRMKEKKNKKEKKKKKKKKRKEKKKRLVCKLEMGIH